MLGKMEVERGPDCRTSVEASAEASSTGKIIEVLQAASKLTLLAKFDEALVLLDRTSEDPSTNPQELILLYREAARTFITRGHLDPAKECLQKALDIAKT